MPFNPDLASSLPERSGIRSVNSAATIEATLEQLLEGDFQARWEAAKQLSAFGAPAITYLVPIIEDDELDWEVRWFAARTLGFFEDMAALEALIALLERTPEPELIAIAAEGLSRFGEASIQALVQLAEQPAHRLTAIQALTNIRHTAAKAPLMKAAQDANEAVRAMAISALGNFRDEHITQLLAAAVQDPAPAVRSEAIIHLGLCPQLGGSLDLVNVLQPRLWDVDLKVRQITASSLGRLRTNAAVAALVQALQGGQAPPALKIQIVRALSWTGLGSALTALQISWPSAVPAVQIEIIEALARITDTAAKPQVGQSLCTWLQSCLEEPASGSIKRAIALAVGQLNYHPAVSLLHQLTADPEGQTRLYAEAALRQLGAD